MWDQKGLPRLLETVMPKPWPISSARKRSQKLTEVTDCSKVQSFACFGNSANCSDSGPSFSSNDSNCSCCEFSSSCTLHQKFKTCVEIHEVRLCFYSYSLSGWSLVLEWLSCCSQYCSVILEYLKYNSRCKQCLSFRDHLIAVWFSNFGTYTMYSTLESSTDVTQTPLHNSVLLLLVILSYSY